MSRILFAFFFFFIMGSSMCLSSNAENDEDAKFEQAIIAENYDKWTNSYLSWLSTEQKTALDKLKNDGDLSYFVKGLRNAVEHVEQPTLSDFRNAVRKIYLQFMFDTGDWETFTTATAQLYDACLNFVEYLSESSTKYVEDIKEIVISRAAEPYTEAENEIFTDKTSSRLKKKLSQLQASIGDTRKRHYAKEFLSECNIVFLKMNQLTRHHIHNFESEQYLIKNADIVKWSNNYLNWLTEEERAEFQELIDDGGALSELHDALKKFYEHAEGTRFLDANKSLDEGCKAFIVYLRNGKLADAATDLYVTLKNMKLSDTEEADFIIEAMIDASFNLPLAETYIPSCIEIIADSKIFKQHVSERNENEQKLILENYKAYETLYLYWLTQEQREELRKLVDDGASLEDLMSAEHKMNSTVEQRIERSKAVKEACFNFITHLTEPTTNKVIIDEFNAIIEMAFEPYTEAGHKIFSSKIAQRAEKPIGSLLKAIKDAKKKQLAEKYIGHCVSQFIFISYELHFNIDKYSRDEYLIKQSDIEKWMKAYLDWLDDEERQEIRSQLEEGASLSELQSAVALLYTGSRNDRLIQATDSLHKGCMDFAEYLLGEENIEEFLEFMEVEATKRLKEMFLKKLSSQPVRVRNMINDLYAALAELNIWFDGVIKAKSNIQRVLAANYLRSCADVFVIIGALREEEESGNYDSHGDEL